MKRLSIRFVWASVIALLLLALTLSLATASVGAQGPGPGDKIMFGDNFTLASGDTLNGDLLVFGGNVDVQEGSTVEGDVATFGGFVTIDGTVTGDVSVVGGSVKLGATAVIEGNLSTLGGSIDRHPDAVVKGNTASGFEFGLGSDIITIPGLPRFEFGAPGFVPRLRPEAQPEGLSPRGEMPRIDVEPPVPPRQGFEDWLLASFLRGLAAIAWAAIMAVLGVLLVVLLPQQGERVARTSRENAALSFGVGCLTQVLAIPVFAILAVTVCLIPLALVGLLLLIVGWLFGWLALGWLIGQQIAKGLKVQHPTPILEVIIGVLLLTLAWQLPNIVPCIGWFVSWLIAIVAGSIGLGAVILTRFGSRPYTPGAGRPAPPLPPLPPLSPRPTYDQPAAQTSVETPVETSVGALPEPETPER